MSYLFCFPVKFSDAIVRLLYPFLVADINATTVSDVFCLFVVYIMYTQHVTYQLRIFSFYNYSRTPLVCFICIKQTVTVAVLYFSSTILGVE